MPYLKSRLYAHTYMYCLDEVSETVLVNHANQFQLEAALFPILFLIRRF